MEPPLKQPHLHNSNPYSNNHYFGGKSIHWLLFKPLYNSHFSTIMAIFFCPQGGHREEIQQ